MAKTDPKFEVLELGDYALVKVSYGEKAYIYTGKRTANNRWLTKPIPEGFFWELIETAQEEEFAHRGDLGRKKK